MNTLPRDAEDEGELSDAERVRGDQNARGGSMSLLPH